MGFFSSSTSMAFVLFTFFVVSSAVEMSILDVHETGWRSNDEVRGLYESWLVKHGKSYNGLGEKEVRFEIFKDNLRFIDEVNSGNRSFKLGLNRFADLTNEEYRSRYLGAKTDAKRRFSKPKSSRYAFREEDELPESVDWRKEGAVASVKDQGSCGELSFL